MNKVTAKQKAAEDNLRKRRPASGLARRFGSLGSERQPRVSVFGVVRF
ncbi:MAG: hypothetical protein JJT96_02760 [Opitutales bacterium]|jgi:hypothetical protein|nr:hypothetical protein [Opitutales bacterium]